MSPDANEVYAHLDFTGDIGKLIIDGEIATDTFYTGQLWEIGLKRYADSALDAEILITPLTEKDKERMYLQEWPKMIDGKACILKEIRLSTQYSIKIA